MGGSVACVSVDIGGWLIWGGVGLQVSGLVMTRFDLVRADAPSFDAPDSDAPPSRSPGEGDRGVVSDGPTAPRRQVAASDDGTVLALPRPEVDRHTAVGTVTRTHHDPRVRRVWRGLAITAIGVGLTASGVVVTSPATPDDGSDGVGVVALVDDARPN